MPLAPERTTARLQISDFWVKLTGTTETRAHITD